MSVEGLCGVYVLRKWLGWSGEVAEPIGSSVPVGRGITQKGTNYKRI